MKKARATVEVPGPFVVCVCIGLIAGKPAATGHAPHLTSAHDLSGLARVEADTGSNRG